MTAPRFEFLLTCALAFFGLWHFLRDIGMSVVLGLAVLAAIAVFVAGLLVGLRLAAPRHSQRHSAR